MYHSFIAYDIFNDHFCQVARIGTFLVYNNIDKQD